MATFVKRSEIDITGARTLPGRYFTSPDILAEEFQRIFGRRWLCVGRAEELAAPGDYLIKTIGTESVIILRDQGGRHRGFFNVCRHRGTRLCEAERGQFSETIQCPYHSWAWSLEGRLLGAPSTHDIRGFDKADYPLFQVAVEEWEGFLFMNLAQKPEPLASSVAPIRERAARYNLPALRAARRITYDVRANWKLLVQNYSECYHCAPVHPTLAKLTPPTSGENDLIQGTVLGGYMVLNEGTGSMTMSGRACGVMVSDLPAEDHDRVYYYSLFPNMLLSLHPDYVMYHTLWPQAPDRTLIHCDWLFHAESLARPDLNPDDGIAFWDMTNRQDWHICEQSQLGVQSSRYVPGPYSARECLAARFDEEVLRALGHSRP